MAKAYFLNITNFSTSAFQYAKPVQSIISGVVNDYLYNPTAREVRLYRWENYMFDPTVARTPYAVTTSNPSTGAYSFTVNENSNRKWVVVCIGEGDNENILAYSNVRVP